MSCPQRHGIEARRAETGRLRAREPGDAAGGRARTHTENMADQ
jgi:hypothetical protein